MRTAGRELADNADCWLPGAAGAFAPLEGGCEECAASDDGAREAPDVPWSESEVAARVAELDGLPEERVGDEALDCAEG